LGKRLKELKLHFCLSCNTSFRFIFSTLDSRTTLANISIILSKEISIVKPDILIIMTTSPNYGYYVREYFGVHTGNAAIETILPRLLYKWSSDKLPFNTFQICHPNSLRFKKGGFTVNVNSIIKMMIRLAQ
jgi:hypothetical protein